MLIRLRIETLERINPDLFGADPDQFLDRLAMKRIIESVAVGEQKVSAEYEVKATILEGAATAIRLECTGDPQVLPDSPRGIGATPYVVVL